MIDRVSTNSRRDKYGSRINRDHSPFLVHAIPWFTILIGSVLQFLPIVSAVAIIPPFGFILMLGWRLVRPGLLPVWAGFPLGLFDDLFSGQPLGSGIVFFSAAMLAIEVFETRFPWRSFWQDWMAAAAAIAVYIIGAALFSGAQVSLIVLISLGPQIVLSILIFPVIARIVAGLDRVRLLRVRVVD